MKVDESADALRAVKAIDVPPLNKASYSGTLRVGTGIEKTGKGITRIGILACGLADIELSRSYTFEEMDRVFLSCTRLRRHGVCPRKQPTMCREYKWVEYYKKLVIEMRYNEYMRGERLH